MDPTNGNGANNKQINKKKPNHTRSYVDGEIRGIALRHGLGGVLVRPKDSNAMRTGYVSLRACY